MTIASSPIFQLAGVVFEEPRTHRRVYGVRYMEWTVDACGLVAESGRGPSGAAS